jgi:hypothetical protein
MGTSKGVLAKVYREHEHPGEALLIVDVSAHSRSGRLAQ